MTHHSPSPAHIRSFLAVLAAIVGALENIDDVESEDGGERFPRSMKRNLILAVVIMLGSLLATSATTGLRKEVLQRVQAAFKAGLYADSLALGGHYEYDARKIKATGGFADYSPPGEANNGIGWGTANYHPGKKAGDLTDSGEVAIMLLENLAEDKGAYTFDIYAQYWKRQIDEGYGSCNFQTVGRDAKGCPPGLKPGYINGGSRRTLQALAANPSARGERRMALAADVNCLIAATHFLPLFLVESDEEKLVSDAVSTVYISHKNSDPVAAAEFLCRTLFRIIHLEMSLTEALQSAAARQGHPLISKWLQDAQAKVAEAQDPSSSLSKEELVDDIAITTMSRLWDIGKTEPIKIGKASPTEGALPSALYFSIKYHNNIEAALIANANCGGDSAARGIVIGMLLGALPGNAIAPTHRWARGLNAMAHVQGLMDTVGGKAEVDAEL